MEEILGGARVQLPHGARYRVLWAHRHRRKREVTIPKPQALTKPYPLASHHRAP